MKAEARRTLFSFLIELLVYSVLVIGYFFLVLHLLGPWLFNLDKEHLRLYAITAVGLIIVQAVLLEWLTTLLFRLIRGRSE
jgi:hypothetical protein